MAVSWRACRAPAASIQPPFAIVHARIILAAARAAVFGDFYDGRGDAFRFGVSASAGRFQRYDQIILIHRRFRFFLAQPHKMESSALLFNFLSTTEDFYAHISISIFLSW